jgi:hypothetical protein
VSAQENPEGLELFGTVVYAALCEVGRPDLIFPSFDDGNGSYYMEIDDVEDDELLLIDRAELLGRQAVARSGGAQ